MRPRVPNTCHALIASILLATCLTPAAFAQTGGVLLRWDQCASDGGTANKNFACDTNVGTDVLVASFRLHPSPFPGVNPDPVGGFAMNFRVTASTATLPAWWAIHSGGCHGGALTVSATPVPGSSNCLDWAPGLGAFVGTSIQPGTNSLRIQATAAAPALVQLTGGVEYFAVAFGVRHTKTVGTSTCAGCTVPMCIAFENVTFENTPYALVLSQGADGESSRFVSWQGSEAQNIVTDCQLTVGDRSVCTTTFSCVPAAVTPVRGSTWGRVKSLYR